MWGTCACASPAPEHAPRTTSLQARRARLLTSHTWTALWTGPGRTSLGMGWECSEIKLGRRGSVWDMARFRCSCSITQGEGWRKAAPEQSSQLPVELLPASLAQLLSQQTAPRLRPRCIWAGLEHWQPSPWRGDEVLQSLLGHPGSGCTCVTTYRIDLQRWLLHPHDSGGIQKAVCGSGVHTYLPTDGVLWWLNACNAADARTYELELALRYGDSIDGMLIAPAQGFAVCSWLGRAKLWGLTGRSSSLTGIEQNVPGTNALNWSKK